MARILSFHPHHPEGIRTTKNEGEKSVVAAVIEPRAGWKTVTQELTEDEVIIFIEQLVNALRIVRRVNREKGRDTA